MGLISPQQASDGVTAVNAASVNNPINTIAAEFNGNIDNANIKSGAAIDGAKLGDTSVTNAKLAQNVAWTSWTPTWTNLTIGNGTQASKYQQIGKTVHAEVQLTFGSTTSISASVGVSLPVTAGTYLSTSAIGTAIFADSSPSAEYPAVVEYSSTTLALLYPQNASGTYLTLSAASSTVPFTWATGDKITVLLVYEAA